MPKKSLILLGILIVLALIGPSQTPVASQAAPIVVEAESIHVVAQGTWTPVEDSTASGGVYLVNNKNSEDILELPFQGSYVEINTVASATTGTLVIEIDAQVIRTVPVGNPSSTVIDYLSDGVHVLRVYGAGGQIAIDSFAVTGLLELRSGSFVPLKVGEVTQIALNETYPDVASGQNEKIIHDPNASYIKVHFEALNLLPGDFVTVSSADGTEVYTYPGDGYTVHSPDEQGFWAYSVLGDTAIIRLHTSQVASSDYGYHIDQYIHGYPPPASQTGLEPPSTCGINERYDAICYESSHPTEYNNSDAVARLLIQGQFLCTAWRVTDDNFMITNNHCINNQTQTAGTEVRFNYQRTVCGSGSPSAGTVVTGDTFLVTSEPYDMTLFTVNNFSTIQSFGFLELDPRLTTFGEEIYIPQHGGGNPKQLAIESDLDTGGLCRVQDPTYDPADFYVGELDLGYYCDTTGGSSGSPVLARSSHQVVALHHYGTGVGPNECSPTVLNSGSRVELWYDLVARPLNVQTVPLGGNSIHLDWNSGLFDATEYRIERSPDGSSGWTQIGVSGTTSFTDNTGGFSCGETVYYRVYGYNENTLVSSAYSPVVAGSTPLCDPTGLTATGAGASQINLAWTLNGVGETNVLIERSYNGSTGWLEIASIGGGSTIYQDTNADCNFTLHYRVRLYRSSDDSFSNYTNVDDGATSACNAQTTVAVVSATAPVGTVNDNDGKLLFSWNHRTHAQWYHVVATNSAGALILDEWLHRDQCTLPTCTLISSTALTSGVHQWWIQGYNGGAGYGMWNNGLTFTLTASAMSAIPVGTRTPHNTAITTQNVTFTWQETAFASGYHLFLVPPSGGAPNGFVSGNEGAEITCAAGTCSRTLELTRNGTWSWYLAPYNAGGTGPWSPLNAGDSYGLRTFTLNATPITEITGRSPAASATETDGAVEFSWNHQMTADRYEVFVGGPNGFVDYRLWDADTYCSGGTCEILIALPTNGNYTWYMRGLGVNDGPWSDAGAGDNYGAITFTVTAPTIGDITKFTPLTNQASNELSFTWEEDANATSYRLYVGGPSGYSYDKTLVAGLGVACGSGTCGLDLIVPYNGTYSWYLQGISAAGPGPWSPLNSAADNWGQVQLTVNAPDPTDFAPLVSPANNAILTTTGTSVIFEWTRVTNATWYNLILVTPTGTFVKNLWYDRAVVCDDTSCHVTVNGIAKGNYRWTVTTWGPGSPGVDSYVHGVSPTFAFAKLGL